MMKMMFGGAVVRAASARIDTDSASKNTNVIRNVMVIPKREKRLHQA